MKKKFEFPTAYTVMVIVMLIVAGLTFMIPAGKYAKLAYDKPNDVFVIEYPNGETKEEKATQETLDNLGIKTQIEKFKDESIKKPVGIPGSYERVKAQPQGFVEIVKAPIQGLNDTIGIVGFVLVIGGLIYIINHTGAFNAGISSLSKALKGRELWLIVVITILVALGGTTFGLAEETIAFYPIVVPIFLAAGYDALVAIAAIYLGSSIGTMVSTTNPFSVVIASDTAGINWIDGLTPRLIMLAATSVVTLIYIIRYAEKVKKDPSQSLIYSQKKEIEDKFLIKSTDDDDFKFTFRRKLILVLFTLTFVIMIWGVAEKKWWFEEMTALFLVSTLIIGILAGMKEKEFVGEFIQGASDLLSVALLISVARGVTIIMENGLISDTVLYGATNLISGMGKIAFSGVMFIIYTILGFFIQSSSGLAVLSMPVMSPLADIVGVSRQVVVYAYQYGQGLISFITPTGLILATLSMIGVTYDKWLKFVMPLVGIMAVMCVAMLMISSYIM